MNIKKQIPNFLTCLNLLCGCIAIVFAFKSELNWSAYFVGIAAIIDFLDGFVARMLKTYSEIGKQLDSLADMISFGVVPGVMLFHYIKSSLPNEEYATYLFQLIPYIGFLVTVFSALRLAKFNIDTRQTDSFIGLPTPANTILIASFALTDSSENIFSTILSNPYLIICISIIMSYLLIAEIPLFALKFKNFNWPGNETRFIFLGIALILLIIFHFLAIPFIVFLYIILSVINNVLQRKNIIS